MGASSGPNDITFLYDNHIGVLKMISRGCVHKILVSEHKMISGLNYICILRSFNFHNQVKRNHREIRKRMTVKWRAALAQCESKERKDWLHE